MYVSYKFTFLYISWAKPSTLSSLTLWFFNYIVIQQGSTKLSIWLQKNQLKGKSNKRYLALKYIIVTGKK